MTSSTAAAAIALALVADASPRAATSASSSPAASVSASPAKLALAGGERGAVTLMNHGAWPVVVRVRPSGVAVDVRGRPRLVARPGSGRGAAPWLAPWPRQFVLDPRRSRSVDVIARVPPGAQPGDHHGALVLATVPARRGAVALRMRVAVRVLVRVAGTIQRALRIRALRARRVGGGRVLEVRLLNGGNVTEALTDRTTIAIRGEVVRIRALRREVLPGAEAVIAGRYSGRARGRVVARVTVRGAGTRTFLIRA
jgi:hypothetical protein